MLPTIYFKAQIDLLKRWLSCQRVTFAPMICLAIATILHIPLCVVFVYWLNFGVIGLAIADAVKNAILLAVLLAYILLSSQLRASLQPIGYDSLRGWPAYLNVSLPAVAMICIEGWAYELYSLLAGIVGVDELASMVTCITIHTLLWKVPLGL